MTDFKDPFKGFDPQFPEDFETELPENTPFDEYRYHRQPRRYHRGYEPHYDSKADYNTNALSYYDFLARFIRWKNLVTKLVNRLLRRDVKTSDTPSITMKKDGDWISINECYDNYNDVITLSADVNISKSVTNFTTVINGESTTIAVPNGTKINTDGIWSPDYQAVLNRFVSEINNIYNNIEEIGDILSQNYIRLTPNVDFTFEMYNNFQFPNGAPIIDLLDNNFTTYIQLRTASGSNEENLLNCTAIRDHRLRHSSGIDTVPESRILGVRFIGQYEYLNDIIRTAPTFLSADLGNAVWYLEPRSAIRNWHINNYVSRRGEPNPTLVYTSVSISDGYGDQLWGAGSPTDINQMSGGLNTNVEMIIHKNPNNVSRETLLKRKHENPDRVYLEIDGKEVE